MNSSRTGLLSLLVASCLVLIFFYTVIYVPELPDPQIVGTKAFAGQDGRVVFTVALENARGRGDVVVGVECRPALEKAELRENYESGYLLVGPVGHDLSKGRSTVEISSGLVADGPFEETEQTFEALDPERNLKSQWSFRAYAILRPAGPGHH